MPRHGTYRPRSGRNSFSEQAPEGIREGKQEGMWPYCLPSQDPRLRPPVIINRTPPAIRTALTSGETRSLWWVWTPISMSPALIPCRSVRGMATKRDAIPRINTNTPTHNRAFIDASPAAPDLGAATIASEIFGKLHQRPHAASRWPFSNPWLVLFHPGGSGDVAVQPRCILGKLFQEHGRCDCSTPTSAGVDDIGDVGTDHLFVFLIQRQAPHFLASLIKRPAEALIHFVIVGEDTGIHISQRHDARPGKGGGIDQMGTTELARVVKTVGQHEPPFGVRVDDFDRLSRHGNLHVTRFLRLS